ncbi:MAG: extracellular solute-binding protein [Anaerolineae bacterium]|nr:extracellular solute-binding protein [Chloroflexota bacterium]MBP6298634.1 extracellular solute-binding protein [Anaerolineae bacterium]
MMHKLGKMFVLALVVFGALFSVSAQDMMSWEDVDPSGQTVVFWHQHTGGREEQLQAIVADFNASNEYGITVEALNQGSYNDIYQRMTVNLASGEALPNLVVAYSNQSATYYLLDGLVDINSLVASEKWGLSEEDVADFFPGFYNGDVFPQYDGARLGFPPNRSMEVMYYNADWLAELKAAGAISFDGPPTTPEQFKEAACAATANPFSGATTDTPAVGYQLSMDASRYASWTFAHGGDIFDGANNAYTLDSEGAVAAISFLKDLFDNGCAGEIFENFGDQTNFGNGATLFTVGSSSGLPFYGTAVSEGAGFNWSLDAIPHTTETPVQNIYGASVSIPKTTPEQELAAWLFVKYYTSPEVQAAWGLASNYFPVRASSAASLTEYMEANPAYKTAFDLLPFTKAEPPVAGYDPVRAEMARVMQAIVTNSDTRPIAEILAELTEFANAELEAASTF